jgi:hypothetical protein
VEVVLTDPPYGIHLETDYTKMHTNSANTYRPVLNDDRPFDASFLRDFYRSASEQFWFGANYYRRTLSSDDLDGSWLVWDKRTEQLDVVRGSSFELIWSAMKHKQDVLRFVWTGFLSTNNEEHQRVHPTEKPIALLSEIITRWTDRKAIVADPFAGSGSTLIAAHKTGRICYAIELDPHYCDLICARYQKETGDLPRLEATGKAHDFLTP